MIHTDLLPLLNEMEFMPEGLMNGLFLAGLLINAVFYCSYPVFLIVYVARGGKEWDTLDTGYTS